MKKKKNEGAIKITKMARYGSIKFVATIGGKQKLVTELVDIVPKTQRVQNILEEVMEMQDNPIIFLGYEDHIMGYDLNSNALIYDAIGIINQIKDENMKYDKENGECVLEWEEYYDSAMEMLLNGQLTRVSLITGRNEEATKEETVDPILMHQFLVD